MRSLKFPFICNQSQLCRSSIGECPGPGPISLFRPEGNGANCACAVTRRRPPVRCCSRVDCSAVQWVQCSDLCGHCRYRLTCGMGEGGIANPDLENWPQPSPPPALSTSPPSRRCSVSWPALRPSLLSRRRRGPRCSWWPAPSSWWPPSSPAPPTRPRWRRAGPQGRRQHLRR